MKTVIRAAFVILGIGYVVFCKKPQPPIQDPWCEGDYCDERPVNFPILSDRTKP